MTTLELRDALNKLLEERPETGALVVYTEGCDCDGTAGSLEVKPEVVRPNLGAPGNQNGYTEPAYVYLRRA